MNLATCLESILFVASRPLKIRALARQMEASEEQIEEALRKIEEKYRGTDSGVQVLRIDDEVRLGTNPACAKQVQEFLKEEIVGELTRPQLEALTVIAYRGPITKAELDMIRGVNCSLILRNLLMRGLIEEKEGHVEAVYSASFDFLRFLGVRAPKDLPEYGELHGHEMLEQLLKPQTHAE